MTAADEEALAQLYRGHAEGARVGRHRGGDGAPPASPPLPKEA